MSRHLSHYPQCAARRPSRRLLSRRGKKSYQIPVPVDQVKDSNYSVASKVAENHSNQMHHPLLSRRSIFASTADGHPPSISEINVGSTDVPTSEKDDDFPIADDDVQCEEQSLASGSADAADEDNNLPDSSMLAEHEEHLKSLDDNGLNLSLFSCQEKVELDLLQTLSNIGAPMRAYEAVMQWTIRSVRSGHVFRDGEITARKTVLSRVSKRLHRDGLKPMWDTLHLPYSNITIKVAYFQASAVFADLLSCGHLNVDTNYIFHGEDWNADHNPYAVPSGNVIGDLNTGQSYIKTHRSLCRNPNDMLLACPLAIDKTMCDIGGCGRLPLEPITIQYGLVKFDVRKKPDAMRVLGYIHPLNIDLQPLESGVPFELAANAPLPMYTKCTNATWKVNEYHMQIDFILRKSGFLDLQERGIKWNIRYRGRDYPTVLHPYVPFIIGDTEGHDTLCGHYKSRTSGVAQLCRVCECPTMKCGWSKARQYSRRKPAVINRLVRTKSFDILKQKSQHMLVNAFDNVRFGAHSDRGIFGACPGEILHLVLLGWFKYVVQSFFKQIGQNGIPGRKYVRLCQDIASQLARQSDRNIPRTTCNDFSSASNIPGHEYAGILLIMLLAFETSRYGEIFDRARALTVHGGHADKHPGHDNFISDWKLLLTSLLEWWAWMKQPSIDRRCVKRSVFATSFLLRRLKDVAPRHVGMKNNTIKTHLVLHMAEDMENFGVPEIFNSAYAESAHIPIAKKTVKNTQKRNKTYEIQAANRYAENLAIAHANRHASRDRDKVRTQGHGTVRPWIGKSYSISRSSTGIPTCRWASDEKKKVDEKSVPLTIDQHLLDTLAEYLLPCLDPPIIDCRTEYTCPKGVLYRAHPRYEEKAWYDHALVDWDDVALPARIMSIVNLHNLKPNSKIKFPGQDMFIAATGLYVIIQSYDNMYTAAEKAANSMHVSPKKRRQKKRRLIPIAAAATLPRNEEDLGEKDPPIFQACRLCLLDNSPELPCLYIVHVDCIVGPTVVIRDISKEYGNQDAPSSHHRRSPPHHIFMSRPRNGWADNWTSFINWQYEMIVHDEVAETSEDDD